MDKKILKTIFCAAFASLVAVLGFVRIPIGAAGIPIVLQNMGAVLCGLFLGPFLGTASVALFALSGAVGLPVFSGARGGLAVLLGPTGGYIFGYVLSAFVSGAISGSVLRKKKSLPFEILRLSVASVFGFLVIYIPAVLWFLHLKNSAPDQEKISVWNAILICALPYFPGDAAKCALSVALALKIRPRISQVFAEQKTNNQNQT